MTKDILIVDDHAGIRMLLKEVLANEGYQVHTAATGKEAIECLLKQSYDLLLLDYQLPVYNGMEVMQRLASKEVQIPTIMMSGMPEQLEESEWLARHVQKIIGKPFNLKEVCELVHSVIIRQTT